MAHSQTIEMMIDARAWLSNMLWTLRRHQIRHSWYRLDRSGL